MKFFRVLFGITLLICGLGLIGLGVYLLFQGITWRMISGFTVLSGLGYFVAKLGIALITNRDIYDAVYFLGRFGWRG